MSYTVQKETWRADTEYVSSISPESGVSQKWAWRDTEMGGGFRWTYCRAAKMSWLYRYCLDGKYGKVSLGHYSDLPLKAARAKRDDLAARAAQGKSPADERKQTKGGNASNPTVREFGERYFREQVVKNWKDPGHIRRHLENEIYPALGDKPLKKSRLWTYSQLSIASATMDALPPPCSFGA